MSKPAIDPQRARQALASRCLAIHEPSLRAMLASLPMRAQETVMLETPQAALLPSSAGSAPNAVAVIPIHGIIESRGGFLSYYFGGSDCETLRDQIRTAVNDPKVGAIVLDVDSPGGDVAGVDELAAEIYNARKKKPITAVSNTLMASAAYYLASQASEVLASPSSLSGSIGVYTLHEDDSELLDDLGIKITLIQFGENKTEGNSFAPLSDSARTHMQEMVDNYGEQFEKAVARGRGLKQEDVHKKFGQGRIFDAKRAVALGMADKVGTLDDALAKHGAVRPSRMRGFSGSWGGFAASKEGDTKRVDGKDCTKRCFAYRPDDKKENWKLPIESPDGDDAWEKDHIRNAISRWSQTDMPDADEKSKARSRIKSAAKKHGIDVSDDSLASANSADLDDGCNCACGACEAGNCEQCTHAGCDCAGCTCEEAMGAKARTEREAMARRIAIETA